jgi:hypothetical protein
LTSLLTDIESIPTKSISATEAGTPGILNLPFIASALLLHQKETFVVKVSFKILRRCT